jgi:hypothetical protein
MKNLTNTTTNELMKWAFANYKYAQKVVFKSEVEVMNENELLHTACAYSFMPFMEGENVIKACASMYVSQQFGTLDSFYQKFLDIQK